MSERGTARAVWARRFVTLLLAIPACYFAYHFGVTLGPSQSASGEKLPPLKRSSD